MASDSISKSRLEFLNTEYLRVFLLFSLSLCIQIISFRSCLSNKILNECLPSAVDSFDYTNRAKSLLESGFDEAFGDAFRIPGYSMVIAFFLLLFGNFAFIALRVTQALLTAVSTIIIYRTLSTSSSKVASFKFSIFYSFLPSWYFSPLLLAESLSYFLCCLFVVKSLNVINKVDLLPKDIMSLSLLVGAATYLKPNHLLWVVPAMFIVYFTSNKKKLTSILLLLGLTGALLSPWLYYANRDNPSKFTFTATSGGNLYIGLGMHIAYDNGPISRAAIFWKVDPRSNPSDVLSETDQSDIRALDEMFGERALEIWKKRPLQQLGFGLAKIAIAFSVYVDSFPQLLLGLLVVTSLFLSLYSVFFRKFSIESRLASLLYISITVILAIQAFLFQADRRFVFPVLIPASILVFYSFKVRNSKKHD